jgi:putative PIG3 family NAD(P)H quinone oxidoreductase
MSADAARHGRAVFYRGAGGVEVIEIANLEIRPPGAGEALVEIAAAGLNRADLLQRRGLYPAPPGAPPDIPGLELAGTVAAVGPGVRAVAVGDRVMAITGGGGMSTHMVCHERELVKVPPGISVEEAAAIPEVFFTAYDALYRQGGLAFGESVLIHAVGSGVGTAALQLAGCSGARPIGTSRTRDKLERCSELGLSEGVLVGDDRAFATRVLELTDGRGVDVILDSIGGAYLEENLRALAPRGRLIMLGLMGGATGQLPLGLLLHKRASVIGTVLRARPLEEKIALAQEVSARIVPLFGIGALKPVIDAVLPISELAEAHRRMEQNQTFGKLVLRW